ncbi:MAG: HPr(Ser) kinase/phosphatase [Clostridia bacterium]|nr:HPr(Ser) kinase/phosphatase [Clostridia bacterium]
MSERYKVSLAKVMKEQRLQAEFLPDDAENLFIYTPEISRPGLAITGFFDYFDNERVEIFGMGEISYLEKLDVAERKSKIDDLLKRNPPAIIVTRKLDIPEELRESCKQYKVPLLTTPVMASECMASLINFLNVELAPRITQHGVFVDVYGEGVLLVGESGIGKSETAIELVKRGHRIIADDAVVIRRVSSRTLLGSSPDNIRHFVELRGVGVVNAKNIFGMGAVKEAEKIDMAIELEYWDPNRVYDRLGNGDEEMEILGNKIPKVTIPIKPGRNMAIIIEVAAMNNRQKKMGYNATEELLRRLGMDQDE